VHVEIVSQTCVIDHPPLRHHNLSMFRNNMMLYHVLKRIITMMNCQILPTMVVSCKIADLSKKTSNISPLLDGVIPSSGNSNNTYQVGNIHL
jgi:hypothetical protein